MKIEITVTETIHGDVGVGVRATDNAGQVLGPQVLASRREQAYVAHLLSVIERSVPLIANKLGATATPEKHTGPMPNFVRRPQAPEKN